MQEVKYFKGALTHRGTARWQATPGWHRPTEKFLMPGQAWIHGQLHSCHFSVLQICLPELIHHCKSRASGQNGAQDKSQRNIRRHRQSFIPERKLKFLSCKSGLCLYACFTCTTDGHSQWQRTSFDFINEAAHLKAGTSSLGSLIRQRLTFSSLIDILQPSTEDDECSKERCPQGAPASEAVVPCRSGSHQAPLSHAQLKRLVSDGLGLHAFGIGRGDSVVVLLPNGLQLRDELMLPQRLEMAVFREKCSEVPGRLSFGLKNEMLPSRACFVLHAYLQALESAWPRTGNVPAHVHGPPCVCSSQPTELTPERGIVQRKLFSRGISPSRVIQALKKKKGKKAFSQEAAANEVTACKARAGVILISLWSVAHPSPCGQLHIRAWQAAVHEAAVNEVTACRARAVIVPEPATGSVSCNGGAAISTREPQDSMQITASNSPCAFLPAGVIQVKREERKEERKGYPDQIGRILRGRWMVQSREYKLISARRSKSHTLIYWCSMECAYALLDARACRCCPYESIQGRSCKEQTQQHTDHLECIILCFLCTQLQIDVSAGCGSPSVF
eukprot:1152182-Pelagomonas_calceolata.AAC.16